MLHPRMALTAVPRRLKALRPQIVSTSSSRSTLLLRPRMALTLALGILQVLYERSLRVLAQEWSDRYTQEAAGLAPKDDLDLFSQEPWVFHSWVALSFAPRGLLV